MADWQWQSGIGVGIFAFICLLWIIIALRVRSKRGDTIVVTTGNVIFPTILFALSVIYLTTFASVYKDAATNEIKNIFAPLIVIGIFSAVYLLTAVAFFRLVVFYNRGTPRDQLPFASVTPRLMNLTKGFGGETFGDFAIAVAVLAGIASYSISEGAKPPFFWLGQIGALLGFLVPVSLAQRWILEAGDDTEAKLSAAGVFFNVWIAVFTVLSLLVPVSDNLPYLGDAGTWKFSVIEVWWLAILGFVTLLFPLITIAGNRIRMAYSRYRERLPRGEERLPHYALQLRGNRNKVIFLILLWLLIVGAGGAIIGFQSIDIKPSTSTTSVGDNWATGLAFFAVLPWVLAEGVSFFYLLGSWIRNSRIRLLDYLKLEKNLWQVVGAIGLLAFLGSKWAGNNVEGGSWLTAFIVVTILAGFGALRGVLRGLIALSKKQLEIEQGGTSVVGGLRLPTAAALGVALHASGSERRSSDVQMDVFAEGDDDEIVTDVPAVVHVQNDDE